MTLYIKIIAYCTQCDATKQVNANRSDIMDTPPKDDPFDGWDFSTDDILCPKCNPNHGEES